MVRSPEPDHNPHQPQGPILLSQPPYLQFCQPPLLFVPGVTTALSLSSSHSGLRKKQTPPPLRSRVLATSPGTGRSPSARGGDSGGAARAQGWAGVPSWDPGLETGDGCPGGAVLAAGRGEAVTLAGGAGLQGGAERGGRRAGGDGAGAAAARTRAGRRRPSGHGAGQQQPRRRRRDERPGRRPGPRRGPTASHLPSPWGPSLSAPPLSQPHPPRGALRPPQSAAFCPDRPPLPPWTAPFPCPPFRYGTPPRPSQHLPSPHEPPSLGRSVAKPGPFHEEPLGPWACLPLPRPT